MREWRRIIISYVSSCGRVMDIMISVKNPAEEINAQWHDGEIEECRMEFYGICNECKKMKN